MPRTATSAVILLLFATAAACQAQVATPAARDVAVDTATLMSDVRVLAADSMQGRATGSPGNAKARRYLLRRFEEAGLAKFGETFEHPFTFSGPGSTEGRGVNVIGWVRGQSAPEQYIVVTAHYDHVGTQNGQVYNGADDNASGTAALLAITEELRRSPPEHSIIIAALDAEEVGLNGARAFVASPPVPRSAILANLNMDMVSRNEAGELWAAGTFHYPNLLPLVQEVAERAPVKLRIGHDRPGTAGEDDWTTSSDHGPFHAAGIPFLYFGVEDHADYHKPADDVERIEPDFYGRAVATIIDALRALDEFLAQ